MDSNLIFGIRPDGHEAIEAGKQIEVTLHPQGSRGPADAGAEKIFACASVCFIWEVPVEKLKNRLTRGKPPGASMAL